MNTMIYNVGGAKVNVFGTNNGAGTVAIPCNYFTEYFKGYIYGNNVIANNTLGLFSYRGNIKTDKYKMVGLTGSSHLWGDKPDNCQFIPKGSIGSRSSEFELHEKVYMGQQCPDEFFGTPWEVLFGTGDPTKMLKTAEGMMLLRDIMSIIGQGLKNDFWNMVSMGGNPLIATSESAGAYKVSTAEFNAFKAQQANVGGFITTADYLKAAGETNFNVAIGAGDVSGESYIGAVNTGLFPAVRAARKPVMTTVARSGMLKEVWLVSRGIFEKYKAEVQAFTAGASLPISYELLTKGAASMGIGIDSVLEWDNKWIVAFDEINATDAILGYDTHFVLATVPGNIPILTNENASTLPASKGFGLLVQQSDRIEDMGKIRMYSHIKVGTGFNNPDLVTYAVRRTIKA